MHDHTAGKPTAELMAELKNPAVDAEIKRPKKIDRAHDIPYLAGYAKDDKTIYLNRDFDPAWTYKGKKVDLSKYIEVHEKTEKAVLDHTKLDYQHAHIIATQAERDAVEKDGIDWDAYSKRLEQPIKSAATQPLKSVPQDLDLTPYKDEHARELMARIAIAQHVKAA